MSDSRAILTDLPDLPLCCRAVLKETNKGKTSVSNYRELRLYFHKQHFNIIQIKPINFTIYCTILELLSLSPSLYIRLRLETRFICMDLLLQPAIVRQKYFMSPFLNKVIDWWIVHLSNVLRPTWKFIIHTRLTRLQCRWRAANLHGPLLGVYGL